MGASLLLLPQYASAQSQPLIQKKIPSSGEAIPIIGIGTARRYEEVKNRRAKKCRCAKPSGSSKHWAAR